MKNFNDLMTSVLTNTSHIKSAVIETGYDVDLLVAQCPKEKKEEARWLISFFRNMSMEVDKIEATISDLSRP